MKGLRRMVVAYVALAFLGSVCTVADAQYVTVYKNGQVVREKVASSTPVKKGVVKRSPTVQTQSIQDGGANKPVPASKPKPIKKAAPMKSSAKGKVAKTAKAVAPVKTAPVKGKATPVKAEKQENAVKGNVVAATSSGNIEEPVIRVLLGTRKDSFSVRSSEPLSVYDGAMKEIFSVGPNESITIASSGGGLSANGKSIGTVLHVHNTKGRYGSVVETLGGLYRGGLQVKAYPSGAMNVINMVALEQYLYGVVPEEAVPSWPMAALKAQAVAARTYALHTMSDTTKRDYDVVPTTYHQVYKGKKSEYASTTEAVKQTRGEVLTYGGKPINALFHSDGGGYTEDSVNVWGNPVPYLKGVKDFSNNAGTSVWNVTTTKQAIETKLANYGKGVGTLQSIELSSLQKRPLSTADRGVSGRVKSMTFVGSKGKSTLTGEQVMSLFGLKSTLFDFYAGSTPPSHVDLGPAKFTRTFTGKSPTVIIHGYGWGHGLGLSQWGAAAMAEGRTEANYYREILTHYYSGVDIVKWY